MADLQQGLVLRKSTSEDCGFTTYAEIAQQVEQLTCNQQVAGSIPALGTIELFDNIIKILYNKYINKKHWRYCGGDVLTP